MKRINLIVSFLFLSIFFLSCGEKKVSSDQELQIKTEESMKEANRQVGMPAITEFQEKKLMKMIYELRDREDLICHAYLYNAFTGKVGQYLGKCIGYGLPYSTQFSNPEKVISGAKSLGYPVTSHESIMSIPQPEPNGLFMPEGLSATWLLLIDPETNEPRPVYVEPEIIVSPFKLHE